MDNRPRAIGQEEETEVIMTGESATETYKKLLEMANKEDVTTNFDRITESPEALAEFIAEDRKWCHDISCSPNCTGCTKDGVLEWLNRRVEKS